MKPMVSTCKDTTISRNMTEKSTLLVIIIAFEKKKGKIEPTNATILMIYQKNQMLLES